MTPFPFTLTNVECQYTMNGLTTINHAIDYLIATRPVSDYDRSGEGGAVDLLESIAQWLVDHKRIETPAIQRKDPKRVPDKGIKTRIIHGNSPVGLYINLLQSTSCEVCLSWGGLIEDSQKRRGRALCSNHIAKPPQCWICEVCKRKFKSEKVIHCGQPVKPYWGKKPDHLKARGMDEPIPAGWVRCGTDEELYRPPYIPKWLYAQLISAGDTERGIALYNQALEILGLRR